MQKYLAPSPHFHVLKETEAAMLAVFFNLRTRANFAAAIVRVTGARCQRVWTRVELAFLQVRPKVFLLKALTAVVTGCRPVVRTRATRHASRASDDCPQARCNAKMSKNKIRSLSTFICIAFGVFFGTFLKYIALGII